MPASDHALEKALYFERRAHRARTDADRKRFIDAARRYRMLLKQPGAEPKDNAAAAEEITAGSNAVYNKESL